MTSYHIICGGIFCVSPSHLKCEIFSKALHLRRGDAVSIEGSVKNVKS